MRHRTVLHLLKKDSYAIGMNPLAFVTNVKSIQNRDQGQSLFVNFSVFQESSGLVVACDISQWTEYRNSQRAEEFEF